MTLLEAILTQGGAITITVDELPDFGIDYEVSLWTDVASIGSPGDSVCGHGGTIEDAARALQTNFLSGRMSAVHHGAT